MGLFIDTDGRKPMPRSTGSACGRRSAAPASSQF